MSQWPVKETYQTDLAFNLLTAQLTQWNRQLSQAVDAYRAMLTMEETATALALKLTVLAQLACICPGCFGPGVEPLPNGEPDVMICMDCNFQHRRHLAASVERTEPTTPSLFIPPDNLANIKETMDARAVQSNAGVTQSSDMVVSINFLNTDI